jgi:MFS family permease
LDQINTDGGMNRLFYGWIIVAAASISYIVLSGATFALSVFIKPMTADLNWTRANVTLGLGLFLLTGCTLAVLTGYLTDRFGPRLIVFIGGMAYTIGFFLASRVDQVWQFYASYSLFGGIGMGCLFVPLTSTIAKWFTDKRGLATGLFYAGGGVGGLILTPLIQAVISHYNWQAGWIVLSIVAAVLILPSALFLRKDPGVMGLRPLGEAGTAVPDERQKGGNGDPPAEVSTRDYTFKEAVVSLKLWLFCLGCFLTFSGILMAQVNLVAYATDKGIMAATAATAMGVLAGFNAAGRLGFGPLADKLGVRHTMIITTLLTALVLFCLNAVDNAWMLFTFSIPFGFLAGGFLTVMPLSLAKLFGTSALGSILGVAGIFTAIGPAFGPVIGATIYDRFGSYFYAFILAGTCAVFSLLIFMLILPQKQNERAG